MFEQWVGSTERQSLDYENIFETFIDVSFNDMVAEKYYQCS